jgi:META domain
MRFRPPARSPRHAFVILAALLSFCGAAPAAGPGFPFDNELRFDGNPVRGSKRVPILQITATGAAEIDLWCASGKGHAVIIEDQITIVPLSMQDNQCPADRLRMDEELLNSLTAVTKWRWDGQLLVLVGPKPLRFRPASN